MKKWIGVLVLALCPLVCGAQTPATVLDVSTPGFHAFPSISSIPATQAFIFKGVPFGYGLAIYFQNSGTFSFNQMAFSGSYDPNYLAINNFNLPLTLGCQTSAPLNTLDISPTQFVKLVGVTSMTGSGTFAVYCAWPGISNYIITINGGAVPATGLGIFAYTYPANNNFFFLTNASSTTPGQTQCVGDTAPSSTAAGTVLPLPCDNTFASAYGLNLGHEVSWSQGQTLGTWAKCLWGGNGLCDPLVATLAAPNSTGTEEAVGISNGFATQGSLLTTNGGQFKAVTATYTSNTTSQLNNFTQGTAGISNGCMLTVNVAGPVTGTTPTLNVYFQDTDGTSGIYADRIAFNQFTTTGIQRAAIWLAPNTGIVPYAPTTGTLAAGTIINGPVLPNNRIQLIVGGTTPSFGNVTTTMSCF